MSQLVQRIEISSKTIIFTVFFIIGLRVIWLIHDLLFALFTSFIVMSALKPLVNRLEGKNIPRPAGALLISFNIGGYYFYVGICASSGSFGKHSFFKNLPLLLADSFPFFSDYFKIESVFQILPNITESFVKVVSTLFSNLFFTVSVLFFSFYFLLEERFLDLFLKKFVDEKTAVEIIGIMQKVESRMGAWMRGQLLLMLIVGIVTYIGLTILGVRFALSLAFLAGILEVVPLAGPIIAAVPAVLVALPDSSFLAGATIILYIIIQQLENNLIVPFVLNKAVGIHPITTLIALSIGAELGGLMGAILAVPTALLLETVIIETFKERTS